MATPTTREEVEAMKPKDRNALEYTWDLVTLGLGSDYDERQKAYQEALAEFERKQREAAANKAVTDVTRPYTQTAATQAWSNASVANTAQSRDDFYKAMMGQYTPTADQTSKTREDQTAAAQKALQDFLSGGSQAQQLQQQQEYANYLKSVMEGRGPTSLSQVQLQRALEQSQRLGASTIASQRGMNTAGAARLIAQDQAQKQQEMAGKSAELAAAEQAAARQDYGTLLNQTRSQSIEAQARQAQAASQLIEAIRTGDQNAISAAMANMANMRQGDITMSGQAQQERKSEMDFQIQQAQQQLQLELQRITMMFNQRQIDEAERVRQEQQAMNNFLAIINAGAAVLGAVRGGGGGGGGTTQVKNPDPVVMKAKGGRISKARVPGKSNHDGDDERNDTVPALLSPGEIVIPRSIAQSPDADKKAAEFIRQLMKHEKSGPKSKRAAIDRIAKLEAEIAALKANSKNAEAE